jgi:hypothetical protein
MFCTKFKSQLKILLRKFDNYLDAHVEVALKVTTGLKKILTSPVADIVTAIIPGNVDNIVKAQIENALNKVIEALAIADSCRECKDVNDKLKCFVAQLQLRDPQLQDAILQKLASLLAGHLDKQRLKQSLYDLYTQAKYSAGKVAGAL